MLDFTLIKHGIEMNIHVVSDCAASESRPKVDIMVYIKIITLYQSRHWVPFCRILLLYVLLGKIYFVTDSLLNVFRTSKLMEENEIDIFYGDQFIPSILCVCFLENCLYNHISVFFLMKR